MTSESAVIIAAAIGSSPGWASWLSMRAQRRELASQRRELASQRRALDLQTDDLKQHITTALTPNAAGTPDVRPDRAGALASQPSDTPGSNP